MLVLIEECLKNQEFFDVAVVIPAFNEAPRIRETLNEVNQHFSNIFVVDDGSTDETFFEAKKTLVEVTRHPINLGQGAAIQTGITKALMNPDINFIVTFDADGQHSINSAIGIVREIKNSQVDIIIGSRFLEETSTNMPSQKKIILKLGIIFTRLDSGLRVTDTHNGLRVMNRKFAQSLNIRHPGMAHASEIVKHIKISQAKWKEFPAQIIYTNYSVNKGQSILNAINILTELTYK